MIVDVAKLPIGSFAALRSPEGFECELTPDDRLYDPRYI